jgi:hypothetical protein
MGEVGMGFAASGGIFVPATVLPGSAFVLTTPGLSWLITASWNFSSGGRIARVAPLLEIESSGTSAGQNVRVGAILGSGKIHLLRDHLRVIILPPMTFLTDCAPVLRVTDVDVFRCIFIQDTAIKGRIVRQCVRSEQVRTNFLEIFIFRDELFKWRSQPSY